MRTTEEMLVLCCSTLAKRRLKVSYGDNNVYCQSFITTVINESKQIRG